MSQDERREVEEPSACLRLSRVVAEPVFAEGFVATRSAPGLASDISGGAKTMLLWCLRTPHVPRLHQQVVIGRPHRDTDWGDHLPFEEANRGRINAPALNPDYTLCALPGEPLETITRGLALVPRLRRAGSPLPWTRASETVTPSHCLPLMLSRRMIHRASPQEPCESFPSRS